MARRLAFVTAGIGWSVALTLPAAVRAAVSGRAEPLLLSLAAGAAASVAAILLAGWTRSAFAPRLDLLIAWYIYLSAA